MDELRRLEARQLARVKTRSRRRRASIIRRRTVRGSLALFAILWAIIFGRLITGNDPALSNNRKSASVEAPTPRASVVREPEAEVAEPEVEFAEPEVEVAPGPEAEAEPEVEFAEPEPEPVEPIITASS